MARQRRKNKKRKYAIIAAVFFVLAAIIVGGFFYWKHNVNKIKPEEKIQEKFFYEINDETIGVNFKIGKNFGRMSSNELQAMNSGFLYGFSIKDDSKAKCYVSQTKRSQGGQVALSFLRDGVFEQIKKNKQDANLDDAQIIDIGDDNKGVKLKISYSDTNQNNIPTVQWEVVGITQKTATFAFCSSPKAVIDLYKDDFNLFLDSLRITN